MQHYCGGRCGDDPAFSCYFGVDCVFPWASGLVSYRVERSDSIELDYNNNDLQSQWIARFRIILPPTIQKVMSRQYSRGSNRSSLAVEQRLPPPPCFFPHLRPVGISIVDPTADFRRVTSHDGKARYILDVVSFVGDYRIVTVTYLMQQAASAHSATLADPDAG